MEIRLSGHTAYRTEYHIVWIPKYRHRILNPGVKGYLVKLFPKVIEQLPGCEIIKCAYVHMGKSTVYTIYIIRASSLNSKRPFASCHSREYSRFKSYM